MLDRPERRSIEKAALVCAGHGVISSNRLSPFVFRFSRSPQICPPVLGSWSLQPYSEFSFLTEPLQKEQWLLTKSSKWTNGVYLTVACSSDWTNTSRIRWWVILSAITCKFLWLSDPISRGTSGERSWKWAALKTEGGNKFPSNVLLSTEEMWFDLWYTVLV